MHSGFFLSMMDSLKYCLSSCFFLCFNVLALNFTGISLEIINGTPVRFLNLSFLAILQKGLKLQRRNDFLHLLLLFYFSTFTALFTNMRILKFKTQLAIAFFAAVNHLNEPLRKQNFTLTGSKGHGL